LWSGKPGASAYDYYYDWINLQNFNVNNAELKNYLLRVAGYWIKECDIDGYRCDVAWGIEKRNPDFWNEMKIMLKKLKPDIFLLAESPVSNYHEGSYLNINSTKFDAAYDWDFRGWSNTGLPAILNGNSSINQLNDIITASTPHNIYPLRFLENHNHPRAAALFGITKSKLGHTITFTVNGIPLIFAGGEMGEINFEPSWTDPANVKPYFKKLIALHKDYIKNSAKVIQLVNTQPASVYSYISKSDTFTVLTAANFSSQKLAYTIDFTSPEIPEKDYKIIDLLKDTSAEMSFTRLQSNIFSLKAWESKVYLMASAGNITTIDDHLLNQKKPDYYSLLQNYPNPFNTSTIIRYELPEAGNVALKVYNILGEEVITLVKGKVSAGKHEIIFNGNTLSGGIYFYKLIAGKFMQTKKFILLK
jgi:hypothetical protein